MTVPNRVQLSFARSDRTAAGNSCESLVGSRPGDSSIFEKDGGSPVQTHDGAGDVLTSANDGGGDVLTFAIDGGGDVLTPAGGDGGDALTLGGDALTLADDDGGDDLPFSGGDSSGMRCTHPTDS